jgi:CBS domain-containing protein
MGAVRREAILKAGERFPVTSYGVISPSTTARKAQLEMLKNSLDFLVVVDAQQRPIAVLTLHNFVRLWLAVMQEGTAF